MYLPNLLEKGTCISKFCCRQISNSRQVVWWHGPWQADACESHLVHADGSQRTWLRCITLFALQTFLQRSRSLSL